MDLNQEYLPNPMLNKREKEPHVFKDDLIASLQVSK